jgi:transcriptional regulator with XRE-family HTH domain
MSQQEVGDALGLSFQQVQKYERGANRISASTLVELAKVLRCRPDALLGVESESTDIDWSRFRSSDAQDAAAAFSAIRNPGWRRAALDLLRAMAAQEALHQ